MGRSAALVVLMTQLGQRICRCRALRVASLHHTMPALWRPQKSKVELQKWKANYCIPADPSTLLHRLWWDRLMLLLAAAVSTVLPFQLAFTDVITNAYGQSWLQATTVVVGFLFLVDIAVCLRTTYQNQFGEIVEDTSLMAKVCVSFSVCVCVCSHLPPPPTHPDTPSCPWQRYMATWLLVDVLAVAPFFLWPVSLYATACFAFKCVRFLRFSEVFPFLERLHFAYANLWRLVYVRFCRLPPLTPRAPCRQ